MTVSIVIAAKLWSNNLEKCVNYCRNLNYNDFEIIVLTDDPVLAELSDPRIKFISTGPLNPADKRDIAARQSKADILAFIDDDAYPREDWLANALENFSDPLVAAVGGPGLTPQDDSLLERASGFVYSSFLVGGVYRYRYIQGLRQLVDDYPSCNFLVRKSIFDEAGGFSTNFWPGEDTKLCLDITKKLGKKIVYDPQVVVYHHRRALFAPHLKQIASYALHRGYFAKRFPQTSFRPAYFLPSAFVLFIALGALFSSSCASFKMLYSYVILFYLLAALISGISCTLRMALFVFLGIILTHLTYGIYFIKGLLSPKLIEEL